MSETQQLNFEIQYIDQSFNTVALVEPGNGEAVTQELVRETLLHHAEAHLAGLLQEAAGDLEPKDIPKLNQDPAMLAKDQDRDCCKFLPPPHLPPLLESLHLGFNTFPPPPPPPPLPLPQAPK
jgi:hypothetical protein